MTLDVAHAPYDPSLEPRGGGVRFRVRLERVARHANNLGRQRLLHPADLAHPKVGTSVAWRSGAQLPLSIRASGRAQSAIRSQSISLSPVLWPLPSLFLHFDAS